jgi:osmotically-inducible protein OsmY
MNHFITVAPGSIWACLLLGAGACAAEEPVRPPPRPAVSAPRDLELTLQARRALGRDDELGKANIQVIVRDGNALLCGRVPAKELIERAVKTVGRVAGVFEVRSELIVVEPPQQPLFPPEKDEEPTRTTAASPPRDPLLTGTLTRLPAPAAPVRPVAEEVPPTVSLKPPVPIRAGETRPDPAALRGPQTKAASELEGKIERVRQGDRRFHSIRTEVRGRVIVVRGGAATGETLMAFIDAVRRVEGVEEVQLNQNPPKGK